MKNKLEKILETCVWSCFFIAVICVVGIYVRQYVFTSSTGSKHLSYNSGNVSGVDVEYELSGFGGHVKIKPISDSNYGINKTAGALGKGVDLTASLRDVVSATITFSYNNLTVSQDKAKRLGIAYYNEEKGLMELLPSTVNIAKGTVSVKTKHFSEYILVDTDEWYDAWLESQLIIRNMNEPEYFDINFALDSSGSMEGTKNELSRNCTYDFITKLYDEDKFSLLTFDSSAKGLLHSKTFGSTDVAALKVLIESITAGGGTDFNAALEEGINELNRKDNQNMHRMIVLLSDGQSSLDESYIDKANDNLIKIITIGFGDRGDIDEETLKDIAYKTGGKYYKANETTIESIFEQIREEYLGVDLSQDTDGDGIPDKVERQGMRNQFGKLIITDPYNADTDGDGRSDGEEMGTLVVSDQVSNADKERGLTRWVYFRMNSHPLLFDERLNDKHSASKLVKEVNITFRTDVQKKDLTHEFHYEDDFFLGSRDYNEVLSVMSLGMAMAAFSTNESDKYWDSDNPYFDSGWSVRRENNIMKAYSDLEFKNPVYYNYEVSLNSTEDKVAYSFAHKTVKDDQDNDVTIIAAVMRGGGYGAEWASNFNVGYGDYHDGFNKAAWDVVFALHRYMASLEDINEIKGDVRFWITGFSRGAAVANALAAKLVKTGYANVYAYCFATPQWLKKDSDTLYDGMDETGIYNVVNPGDIVPMVALTDWGFGRVGADIWIADSENTYHEQQESMVDKMMQKKGVIPKRDVITDEMGHFLMFRQKNETRIKEVFAKITGDKSLSIGVDTPAQRDFALKVCSALKTLANSSSEYVDKYQGLIFDTLAILNTRKFHDNNTQYSFREILYDKYSSNIVDDAINKANEVDKEEVIANVISRLPDIFKIITLYKIAPIARNIIDMLNSEGVNEFITSYMALAYINGFDLYDLNDIINEMLYELLGVANEIVVNPINLVETIKAYSSLDGRFDRIGLAHYGEVYLTWLEFNAYGGIKQSDYKYKGIIGAENEKTE